MSHAAAGAARRALDLARDGPPDHRRAAHRGASRRLRALSLRARSTLDRGAAGAWDQPALLASGQGLRHRGQGRASGHGHSHRVGKDALLQPAGAAEPRAAAGGARSLSLPHQGARAGSARRAHRPGEVAPRSADVHLRWRHAAGRAAGGAGARQPRAEQSRHAALGNPPAPHQVGEPLPEPALRGGGRAARVSRGVRQPPRQCPASAQAHLPPLRLDAPVHHGLRHHRESPRAGGAAHRRDGDRAQRRAALPSATRCSSATTPRW